MDAQALYEALKARLLTETDAWEVSEDDPRVLEGPMGELLVDGDTVWFAHDDGWTNTRVGPMTIPATDEEAVSTALLELGHAVRCAIAERDELDDEDTLADLRAIGLGA